MLSDTAIKVSNLSKCYYIYDKPQDRLFQILNRNRKKYYREFWALKNASFEVKKGETIGIIGKNGSGKSTLLQMICGTLTATEGYVEKKGRVAALLELGSGFNPEFTGRENIQLNASMLGLSKKEIDECLDDIIDFADIDDFIDQPIKTYSTGMAVRLAFAVQSQVNPDILIVDEALAVGDAKFQAKCFERLKQLRNNGTSILLVTHSSEQIVAHCSQAVLLNNGSIMELGDPRHVINCYHDLLFGKKKIVLEEEPSPTIAETIKSQYQLSVSEDIFSTRPCYNPYEYRWGDEAAKILDFFLEADNTPYPSVISTGQFLKFQISIQFLSEIIRPILGIRFKTKEGVVVYDANSETLNLDEFKTFGGKGKVIQSEISFKCNLAPGDYFVSLGIASRQGEEIIPHDRRYDSIHIHILSQVNFFGLVDLELQCTTQEVSI